MCYRGSQQKPEWIDTDPGIQLFQLPFPPSNKKNTDAFTTVCNLEADLSLIPKTVQSRPDGGTFYTMYYDLVLVFGLTELQAQMRWFENVGVPSLFFETYH
jgi:hypothetical protein